MNPNTDPKTITLMSPMNRKKKPIPLKVKACVVFNMIILMNIAFVEKLPQYLEILHPEVNNRTLTRTENQYTYFHVWLILFVVLNQVFKHKLDTKVVLYVSLVFIFSNYMYVYNLYKHPFIFMLFRSVSGLCYHALSLGSLSLLSILLKSNPVFIPIVYESSIALGRSFAASSFWVKEDFEELPTFLFIMMTVVNTASLVCAFLMHWMKID
jgi:hypothetical protein